MECFCWKTRSEELVELFEASAWTESQSDYLQRLVDATARLFSCDQAHIHLITAEADGLDCCASSVSRLDSECMTDKLRPGEVSFDIGRIRWMIRNREVVVSDYENPDARDIIPSQALELGYRWSATFPVFVSSAVYGMCSVVYKTSLSWGEEDNAFALLVGRTLGAAIAKMRACKASMDLAVINDRRDLSFRVSEDIKQMIANISIAADSAEDLHRAGKFEEANSSIARLSALSKESIRRIEADGIEWNTPLYLTDSLPEDIKACLERFCRTWSVKYQMVSELGDGPLVVSMQVASQLVRILREVLGMTLSAPGIQGRDEGIRVGLKRDEDYVTMTIDMAIAVEDQSRDIGEQMNIRVLVERARIVGGTLSVIQDASFISVHVDVPMEEAVGLHF